MKRYAVSLSCSLCALTLACTAAIDGSVDVPTDESGSCIGDDCDVTASGEVGTNGEPPSLAGSGPTEGDDPAVVLDGEGSATVRVSTPLGEVEFRGSEEGYAETSDGVSLRGPVSVETPNGTVELDDADLAFSLDDDGDRIVTLRGTADARIPGLVAQMDGSGNSGSFDASVGVGDSEDGAGLVVEPSGPLLDFVLNEGAVVDAGGASFSVMPGESVIVDLGTGAASFDGEVGSLGALGSSGRVSATVDADETAFEPGEASMQAGFLGDLALDGSFELPAYGVATDGTAVVDLASDAEGAPPEIVGLQGETHADLTEMCDGSFLLDLPDGTVTARSDDRLVLDGAMDPGTASAPSSAGVESSGEGFITAKYDATSGWSTEASGDMSFRASALPGALGLLSNVTVVDATVSADGSGTTIRGTTQESLSSLLPLAADASIEAHVPCDGSDWSIRVSGGATGDLGAGDVVLTASGLSSLL